MSKHRPLCRVVTVHTFRGSRGTFGQQVRRALAAAISGTGPEPTSIDCLLYAGHTGVSTDEDRAIYGFNPNFGTLTISQGMQRLRNGNAFVGVVSDDSAVFTAAQRLKLRVKTFDVILPQPVFVDFDEQLRREKLRSRYEYGFPNGDGMCNCTTWLERLALPLLSGGMDEFTGLPGFRLYPRRRFGVCV